MAYKTPWQLTRRKQFPPRLPCAGRGEMYPADILEADNGGAGLWSHCRALAGVSTPCPSCRRSAGWSGAGNAAGRCMGRRKAVGGVGHGCPAGWTLSVCGPGHPGASRSFGGGCWAAAAGRRIIPPFSSARNSSSSTPYFSLSSRQGWAKMGAALPVPMWWTPPWRGLGVVALGHNSVGNSLSNCWTWGGRTLTPVSMLQGFMKEETCLGEGGARCRVQNLLFRGDYRKAKMSEKIHAK